MPMLTSALSLASARLAAAASLQKEQTVEERHHGHKKHTHMVVSKSAVVKSMPQPHGPLAPPRDTNPALEPALDPVSDKEFFGPPHPGDYQWDDSPSSIRQEKGRQDYPYPATKTNREFDHDFVDDTDHDGGEWEAQMEYDKLRVRTQQLEKDELDSEATMEAEQVELDRQIEAGNAASGRLSKAQHEWEVKEVEKQRLGAAVKDKIDQVNETQAEVEMHTKELARAKKEMEEASARLQAAQENMREAESGVEGLSEARKESDEAKALLDRERSAFEENERSIEERLKRRDQAARTVNEQKRELEKARNDAEAARKRLARYARGDVSRTTGDVGGLYSTASTASLSFAFAALLLL